MSFDHPNDAARFPFWERCKMTFSGQKKIDANLEAAERGDDRLNLEYSGSGIHCPNLFSTPADQLRNIKYQIQSIKYHGEKYTSTYKS